MAGLLIWSENLKNHVKYRNSLFTDIKAIVFFIVKVPEPKIAENYQINLIQNHNIWVDPVWTSWVSGKNYARWCQFQKLPLMTLMWITKFDKTEVDFLRWYNFSPQRFDMAQIHLLLYFSFLSVQSRMANQWEKWEALRAVWARNS